MKRITIYDIAGRIIAEGEDRQEVIKEAREKHSGNLVGVEMVDNGREKGFIVSAPGNVLAALG